jgi:hypothetical protein
VLTPAGWTTMGAMRVGSQVIGSDGKPHDVVAVYPQGDRKIFRVTFSSGAKVECTDDHLWSVASIADRRAGVTRQMTLSQIMASGPRYRSGPAKWSVPLVEPIQYASTEPLPVAPYLLGSLLGDGYLGGNRKGSGAASLACHSGDLDEQIALIEPMLPPGNRVVRRDRKGLWSELSFAGPGGRRTNPLTEALKALGVWGKRGHEKAVPGEYQHASVSDRIQLLQGLIDTDGHVERRQPNHLRLDTTSEALANDIAELVGGLGGLATVRIGRVGTDRNRPQWRVTMSRLPEWIIPCRLARKAEVYRPSLRGGRYRYIRSIEYVGVKPAQCISVDSDDHLYVTDDYVLTHNTPNLVVKGIAATTPEQFRQIVDDLEQGHAGVANAYKTLYLGAGADATVVGSHLGQIDFGATQGRGETRISVLSRVPASLLGISEGLSGSSLNAGNFNAARRMFADSWVYPTLQDLAASLAPLLNVPADAELWFDPADMVALREDAKDAAEIMQIQMSTIVAGVNGGFKPESVVAATIAQDPKLLKHSGLVSVQLQQPGAQPPSPSSGSDAGPKALPQMRAIEDDELDEDSLALLTAMNELDGEHRAAGPDFNVKHPRGPGGRFRTVADRVKEALQAHLAGGGDGDPFKDFNREQLRKVAKARGIELKRGEDRESIAQKLLDSLKGPSEPKVEPKSAVEKAVPAKAVKPSAPLGGRVPGKDITKDVDFKSLPASYNPKTNENDALKAVLGRQGFDGKPQVVSREDFDAALGGGEVRETWRGLSGSGAGTYAEQFRTGELRAGLGINGDGTYVALSKADGEYYGSTLLRIGLAKDAKVISADDLDREMDTFFAQVDRRRKSAELRRLDEKLLKDLAAARTARDRANIRRKYRDNVFGLDSDRSIALQRDPGVFAALRGYDAIEIPKERSPDKHHEMIILNRTATIVQEV